MVARTAASFPAVHRTAPLVWALVAALLIALDPASAFRVSPLRMQLAPSGPAATDTLQIENTLATPLTVELTVYERAFDPDGRELRRSADDDFSLFPPQAVVEPGAIQAVRIQFVGEPKLREARNYVVLVTQLPVDLGATQEPGVKFVLEFGASVTVSPPNARADLMVTQIAAEEDGALLVTVENRGDGLARLGDAAWSLRTRNGNRHRVPKEALREQLPSDLLLPGASRHFTLPLPANVAAASVASVTARVS